MKFKNKFYHFLVLSEYDLNKPSVYSTVSIKNTHELHLYTSILGFHDKLKIDKIDIVSIHDT